MKKTITVTFKENEADLYNWIKKWHSSPASYLKDLAIKDKECDSKPKSNSKPNLSLFKGV